MTIFTDEYLKDFTFRAARYMKVKVLEKKNGRYPTRIISVPIRSPRAEIVFYEFVFIHRHNTKDSVAIHLCEQYGDNMRRLEVIYLNGDVAEGNWVADLEEFIPTLRDRFASSETEAYKTRLEGLGFVEEGFCNDLVGIANANALLGAGG